jgi:hypothetical protein
MNPIADQNIERLLQVAYHPENPDPEFVASLEQRMLAAAHAAEPPLDPRLVRRRVILGWLMGTAVAIACVGLFLHGYRMHPKQREQALRPQNLDDTNGWLTAKARSEPAKAEILAAGKTLKTGDKERRRAALPDGSLVFLNAGTSIRVEGNRQLSLESGEIFVEVAPNPNERFLVRTPDKQVTALGTKFVVRNLLGKTGVVVTQGKVQVSGLDSVLEAGQQLLPDGKPAPAPRASSVLDWTRDLFAESPLVPANQHTGGALLAFNPNGQEAKISLRKFHLDVHVEDGFARTTIDQTYFNHEWQQLEGTFYFPLPPDASISRLAMYVNGELMEGGMAERDHARNTFETIRYAKRDPALLEWVDGSTFKMRVFPLEGQQEKRIILSYTQRLPVLSGKMSYRFPLEHNLKLVDDFSIQFRLKDGVLLQWNSPSHLLKPVLDGRDVVLATDAKNQKLDKDVQLELTGVAGRMPVLFSSLEYDGQRYVMLRYRPELALTPPMANPARKGGGEVGADTPALTGGVRPGSDGATAPRHFLILFETSADRDPLLARTQIEILHTILENLEHTDTFQILSANTQCQWLSEHPLAASPENIERAIAQLEKAHLIGALDLGQALETIQESEPRRLEDSPAGLKNQFLLHLGSAIPALGERREDALAKRIPEGLHYAGIGVGKRWSRSFMKQAAERTGGHFTQINPDEPVSWRAFEFLSALMAPRWQQLSVKDNQGRDWLLQESSVAAGEELCVVVRQPVGEALPGLLTIKGTQAGRAFEKQIELEGVGRNAGYLPRTWGKLEIDRLLAEDSQKNKPAIIDLSKTLYVMSPFTSLLVLENEAMYKQFNIDRGRKDHWAIYPCPQKIEVPKPADAKPEPKPTKSVDDVLATIVWRNARPVMLGTTAMNYIKRAQIEAIINGKSERVDWRNIDRTIDETSTGTFLLGLGVNSDAGLSGEINIIGNDWTQDRILLRNIIDHRRESVSQRIARGARLIEMPDITAEAVDSVKLLGLADQINKLSQEKEQLKKDMEQMELQWRRSVDSARGMNYIKRPELGGFYTALEYKTLRMRKGDQTLAVRGFVDVDGSVQRELGGRFMIVGDRVMFDPDPKFVSGLTPPGYATNDLNIPIRARSFMSDGSVRSPMFRNGFNQGLGYWNANGPLDWDGDGMLMDSWIYSQPGPWGAPRATNAVVSRPYIAALDDQKNSLRTRITGLSMDLDRLSTFPGFYSFNGSGRINLNSTQMYMLPYIADGTSNGPAFMDGTSNTIIFADDSRSMLRNGNYAGFNPYMHLRPRPADQLFPVIVSGEVAPGDLNWAGGTPDIQGQIPLGNVRRYDYTQLGPDVPRRTRELIAKMYRPADIDRDLDARLADVLEYLSDRFDLTLIINDEAFRKATPAQQNVEDVRVKLPSSPRVTLRELLDKVLANVKGGFIVRRDFIEITTQDEAAREPLQQNGLFYQRPAVLNSDRIFHDLVQYAPGMETGWADVQAVVEAETLARAAGSGRVDPQARAMVERARSMGWGRLPLEPAAQARDSRRPESPEGAKVNSQGRQPLETMRATDEPQRGDSDLRPSGAVDSAVAGSRGLRPWLLTAAPPGLAEETVADASGSLLCDGTGRFAIERTLASGLKEQILCDGQTLLHLYPEIGIGAKRSFSRFHFAELQALIPWLLPEASELARNADVLAYGSNTVAIVPHGKTVARVETHLVFDDAGRLQERRWVLMPYKLVLARQKFTAKSYGEPAAEPNLKPDTSKLVVLPLPYRTVKEVTEKQQRQSWWQRAFNDPLELAAAHYADTAANAYANSEGVWLIQNVIHRGDTRPGWFTLIRAQNANVMPLAPKDSQAPVLKYLQNRTGTVGEPNSFLQRMMDLYYVVDASHGLPPLVKPPEWAPNVRRAIERNRDELGAAALLLLAQRGGLAAEDWKLLAELWKLFEDLPGFWYTSHYERIRCLMSAGQDAQARQEFDRLYTETLSAGVIPPLDSLYAQLPGNPVQLLKNAARERGAQCPEDVLALAWQSAWLGPQGTTQEIMAEFRPSTKWPEVTLSAVLLWQQLGQWAAAQERLDEMLGDSILAKQPGLWRLAAELAGRREQGFRQTEFLEKALDLEFAHLPETVDVQKLREDYGALLHGFSQIIDDHWQKDGPLPANLAARIVKAADRWRSIDPEANDACMQASDLLSDLNEPKLAWQYLTTVVALHPNEANPYRQMAQHLAERNDWKLAEKAYAAAFAAEPTDAQLLYDRAKALEKGGRRPEAAALMKQLADGNWQPRFDNVKWQARQWLAK